LLEQTQGLDLHAVPRSKRIDLGPKKFSIPDDLDPSAGRLYFDSTQALFVLSRINDLSAKAFDSTA
jgi:hypothetical protein